MTETTAPPAPGSTADLRDRLQRAIANLDERRVHAGLPYHERERLADKAEGVRLALSYIHDAERLTPTDPESLAEQALALLGVEATPENVAKVLSIRLAALAPDVAAAVSEEPGSVEQS